MYKHIPFNKPYLSGKEIHNIYKAVSMRHLSGNGTFTKMCHQFFQKKYAFQKCLLTTSCTDALEMTAILMDIRPGDEVIVPSYAFVSTALAFDRQGAHIVFADSRKDHPGIDEDGIESLITKKTKAIIIIHYAGVACDMHKINALAKKHKLFVVEDAAQSIDSYYYEHPLGSLGDFACFSFHETKNIQCGEGGMLVINKEKFNTRAEIIWEKGTNRAEFFRGNIDKYNWVDTGSSFLPSEIIASFLYAQLEELEIIQEKRKKIWQFYYDHLADLALENKFSMPQIPPYATNNAHMFYLITRNSMERDALIKHLKAHNCDAVFHYISLHKSPYYKEKHTGNDLKMSDHYTNCLLRLPFFLELEEKDISFICSTIRDFYKTR
jgi:dTDP-4-amino-4,6-dideoxygalactose transaminase